MSALIASLLAILGPIIGKLLTEWLAKLFQSAAKKAGIDGDDTPENREELMQAAIDATKGKPFKRLLLRHLKALVVTDRELNFDDFNQLRDLVNHARKES